MGFKDYVLKTLFYPKVVIYDKPGLFYSKTTRKYGSISSSKRLIWIFEDVFSNLQNDTIKNLGLKKTEQIWYSIGYHVGKVHMDEAGAKKIPKFILNSVLKYILNAFRSAGGSAASDIQFNKKEITLKGKNNIICRKTGMPYYNLGVIAGIYGVLSGEQTKGISYCMDCPKDCHLEFTKGSYPIIKIKEKNISQKIDFNIISDKESFKDFLRFKKIVIEKDGKHKLYGRYYILPTPPLAMGIISKFYRKEKQEAIFENSIINTFDRIFREIAPDSKNKLKSLETLFSALGLGLLETYGTRKLLLRNPPDDGIDYAFFILILKTCLEQVHSKKLEFETKYDSYSNILSIKII